MPASLKTDIQARIPQSPEPYIHHKRRPKSGVRLNKLMLSTYFRIALTFLLLIMLFLTASFIAFQSEQKRKKLKDYEKQIPEAEILIPETEEISSENWDTYTNSNYSYSVNYPSEWQVVESKPETGDEIQKVTLIEQEVDLAPGIFEIVVNENPQNLDTQSWADQYFRPLGSDPTVNLATFDGEAIIDGVEARKFLVFNFSGNETVIGLVKNGFIYTFIFLSDSPNDPNLEKHNKIYNQILSTFKFLD